MKIPILLLTLGLAHLHAGEKPNVLFIAVDDLRCDLGCYGVSHVKSPHIDQLANSGMRFDRAYCQVAVCNPSRASLMTGLRPDTIKVWHLPTKMRDMVPDVVTLPQHFRKSGYRAVAFGKIYHNPFPDPASWDEPNHNPKDYVGYSEENRARLEAARKKMREEGRPAPRVNALRGPACEIQDQPDERNFDGRQTIDAIAKMRELAAGEQPFFLAVGYILPHLPFVVPKPWWDLYDRTKIPLATNPFFPRNMPEVAFGKVHLGGMYELRDYMDYADAPMPFDGPLPEDRQRELRHGYYAATSFIDAQVGRLLATLEQLGLAENTIVVLWGDHGWKLGEHGGWCKQTNFEIDTRAPLIIRAPGVGTPGRGTNALVEFIDIYPTLCDLAGLPVPENLEGVSLKPLIEGKAEKVKDAAISQYPRHQDGKEYMGYALRTDRYRYIEWLNARTGTIEARELYDHAKDPQENENVAGENKNAELLDQLNKQLWQTIPRPALPYPYLKPAPPPGTNGK